LTAASVVFFVLLLNDDLCVDQLFLELFEFDDCCCFDWLQRLLEIYIRMVLLEVLTQMDFLSERTLTFVAMILFHRLVDQAMFSQIGSVCEAFVANVADVVLLLSVRANVNFE